VERPEKFL